MSLPDNRWPAVCLSVSVVFCATAPASASTEALQLQDTLVVTSTREARSRRELPESVAVLDQESIKNVAPSHPAELLNRVPGVHVNNLGGEGHMTAIRQPITTGGLYLFMEDGIPTRPTGYFNHNGLYEVNISQSVGVEVTRGAGSALYGSDAIGGIINTLTAPPPVQGTAVTGDLELGSHGWARALLSAGAGRGEGAGVILNLNVTDSQGYRDHAGYDRQSATLRWDTPVMDAVQVKTIVAWNRIGQSGVSGLDEEDYRGDRRRNYFQGDIAQREVYALRLSSEWALELSEQTLLTLTPFYRDNRMDLMPSWMMGFDPQVYSNSFQSYGLLAKYRYHIPAINGQIITGVDMDRTPSRYREDRISVLRDGKNLVDHELTGRRNYDFAARQESLSPYVHLEWQLLEVLRPSLGLRYDHFTLDYEDRLDADVAQVGPIESGRPAFVHHRPEDQRVSFDQVSPKAGLVYRVSERLDIYTNYRHGFRTPTAGQLFRAGANADSTSLQPIRSDSVELGTRGTLGLGATEWQYEASVYHMAIRDDIVGYIEEGVRHTTNAGQTRHRGLELGLESQLNREWGTALAWAWNRHEYRDFSYICSPPVCAPAATRNYSGNDMAQAPRYAGNISLHYQPLALGGLRLELQMERLGSYYLDETNTESYGGHSLFHLRARYELGDLEFYARIENLSDERYSTYASKNTSGQVEYRPGLPRSGYLGARYRF